MTVVQLTATATALGIKLTNANEGTEIYQCWADRVLLAALHAEKLVHSVLHKEHAKRRDEYIAEANRYAV